MTIHFICRGNILRSIIAEAYVKSLNLKDISVVSSGTNVNWDDPLERTYFARTLSLLESHGLQSFAKQRPDQLNQDRIDAYHDVIVLMNQRVFDEAEAITILPKTAITWDIGDIGEPGRLDVNNLEDDEEHIFREITQKVDALVANL